MAQVTYTLRKGEDEITGIPREKAEEESSFFQCFFGYEPDENGSIVIDLDDKDVAVKYRNIKFENYEFLCEYIKTSEVPDLKKTNIQLCNLFNAMAFLTPGGQLFENVVAELRRRLKKMYDDLKKAYDVSDYKKIISSRKKIMEFEKNIIKIVEQKHMLLQDKFPRVDCVKSDDNMAVWNDFCRPLNDEINGFKTKESIKDYSPVLQIYLFKGYNGKFVSGLDLQRVEGNSKVEIRFTEYFGIGLGGFKNCITAHDYQKDACYVESIDEIELSSEENTPKDPNQILKTAEENASAGNTDGKPYITLKLVWKDREMRQAALYHNDALAEGMKSEGYSIRRFQNNIDILLAAWELYQKMETLKPKEIYRCKSKYSYKVTYAYDRVLGMIVTLCKAAYVDPYTEMKKETEEAYEQLGYYSDSGIKIQGKKMGQVKFLQCVQTAVNTADNDLFKYLLESPMGLFFFALSSRVIPEYQTSPPYSYEGDQRKRVPVVSEIVTYVAKYGTTEMFDIMAALPCDDAKSNNHFDPYLYACALPPHDMISAEDQIKIMEPIPESGGKLFKYAEYYSPLFYAFLGGNGRVIGKIEEYFRNHKHNSDWNHWTRSMEYVYKLLRCKNVCVVKQEEPLELEEVQSTMDLSNQIDCIDMFLKKIRLKKIILDHEAKEQIEAEKEDELQRESEAKRVKRALSGGGGPACNIVAAFVDMSLSPAKMSFKEK